MDLGFRGEIADFYHRYRRGYPSAVIDDAVNAFRLSRNDVVVDLGCGTGQLALPIAGRVRAVAGVDPEPDMLARARRAAAEQGIVNVSWVVGRSATATAARSGRPTAKARKTSSPRSAWSSTPSCCGTPATSTRGSGQPVHDEDVARLSPLGHAHLNCLGRYAFTTEPTAELRPRRDPNARDSEDDGEL